MDAFSQMIITAVNQVKNAVVKIDVYKTLQGKLRPAGSGSGFIFSSDGLIFTNHHVVSGAEKIMVSLLNENEIEATLIGKDPDTDLAILKIYTDGYSSARLGDASTLQIGQFVIAIGNPLGYQHTVPQASSARSAAPCALSPGGWSTMLFNPMPLLTPATQAAR